MVDNRKKYNEIEFENDLELNGYDAHFESLRVGFPCYQMGSPFPKSSIALVNISIVIAGMASAG